VDRIIREYAPKISGLPLAENELSTVWSEPNELAMQNGLIT
jgi:hypothetical protein